VKTLYLDPDAWDLAVDAAGNIAVAGAPYARAQDAASGIRTFEGECWYDTSIGVPYWPDILGHAPPIELLRAHIVAGALAGSSDIAGAQAWFTQVDREVHGQVQVTGVDGAVSTAGF